jgi:hypothetical protein
MRIAGHHFDNSMVMFIFVGCIHSKTQNLMLYKLKFLLLPISLLLNQMVFSQPVINTENEAFIASIDSNTIKLRNKLYPSNSSRRFEYLWQFEENDVPVYADSVYKYRLSLLETEIPLDYNQYVKGYIDLYAIRKRALVSKILSHSAYYFPIVEDIFNRENIPLELKYLAVIESALNQNAVSLWEQLVCGNLWLQLEKCMV